MRLPTTALSILATVPMLGCPSWFTTDEGGEGPPCGDDILGCASNEDEFMFDPSCELSGSLELVLGQGEESFQALAPEEVPALEFGFQGGQHIWAAVQVQNPATDYPQLQIDITLSFCNSGDCSSPSSWQIDNTRRLVADQSTMRVTPEGWFEQTRMLVTAYGYGGGQGRLEMTVTDPCGRQGYAIAQGEVPPS